MELQAGSRWPRLPDLGGWSLVFESARFADQNHLPGEVGTENDGRKTDQGQDDKKFHGAHSAAIAES